MRVFFASICAVAFAAFIASPSPAKAAGTMLTGEMAGFNFLLGAPWSCTTSVPAIQGMAAHTDQLTVTFDVAPRNILHDQAVGGDYMGDDYYGYSSRFSNYWSTSADNMGVHGFATSADGKTFTGTSAVGPMTMDVTTTYTKIGPNSNTMHQVISAGGQQSTIDSTCKR